MHLFNLCCLSLLCVYEIYPSTYISLSWLNLVSNFLMSREQPPDHILRLAKNTHKFFKCVGSIHHLEDGVDNGGRSVFQTLTEEEYEARESKKPVIGKRYFNYVKLEDIVSNYPHRKNLTDEEFSKENLNRLALIDFLRGLFEFDPVKRWSPLQAVKHPFVTGEPFICPYKPPPEKPHNHASQNITVEHNPGRGHWFAAGLSPQVSNVKGPSQNSPHLQVAPMSLAGSYVSLGSHGSYSDGAGFGGSYGSYGDNSINVYYSPARTSVLNSQAQGGSVVGACPDSRWRNSQLYHGNGFGVSSSIGSFGPMSLGASPSQFTPPGSQIHVSAGSPGKYGPSSPARGNIHASPLGKVAFGQSNRRRSFGYAGKPLEISSQHWEGSHADGINYSHPEGNSRGFADSSHVQSTSNPTNWRFQRDGNAFSSGSSSTIPQNIPLSYGHGYQVGVSPSSEPYDKPECSSPPGPEDWDPNYSDELLFEEDISDVSSLASGVANVMHLNHSADSTNVMGGVGRFNCNYNLTHPNSNGISSNQRTKGMVQAFSHAEGSPTSVHDIHVGYGRPNLKSSQHIPHFPQNSPSRFGQQPRFNHVQATFGHGEHNHPKGQPSPASCNPASPHSRGTSIFTGGTQWGRRTGHPITTIPPTSHARKDYGRIT